MLKSRGEGSTQALWQHQTRLLASLPRKEVVSRLAQAYPFGRVERFAIARVIQTLKHEVLNGFCVVNEQHLDYILRVGADWYNHRRGHSGRDHLPPVRDEEDPPIVDLAKHKLVCHGEHLKSYRAAA